MCTTYLRTFKSTTAGRPDEIVLFRLFDTDRRRCTFSNCSQRLHTIVKNGRKMFISITLSRSVVRDVPGCNEQPRGDGVTGDSANRRFSRLPRRRNSASVYQSIRPSLYTVITTIIYGVVVPPSGKTPSRERSEKRRGKRS